MTFSHIARAAAAFAAFIICTGTAMSATQDDTIATPKGPVAVHAIHHASLMLTFEGKHILVDPAPIGDGDPVTGYRKLPTPDVILYTHNHYDHFNVAILEAVAGPNTVIVAPQEVDVEIPPAMRSKVKLMKNGDKAVVAGVPIEAEAMYNTTPDRMKFHPKGKGNGYVLTLGGERIYIAGDTEETPETAHLADIDAAFLPMNLPYTETVEAAAKWVKDFKPHIVYPYHYHNQDGTLSDLSAFKKDVGSTSEVRELEWY